ncbi:von Willebrand factor d and egf domain-containing protein, partial [Plakobranchus ocellatus]
MNYFEIDTLSLSGEYHWVVVWDIFVKDEWCSSQSVKLKEPPRICGCTDPTSQVIQADDAQLTASSTRDGLSPSFVKYGCCTELNPGGWCPESAAVDRKETHWVDVSFYGPINVTSVTLQPPNGLNPPLVNAFRLLYEPADGELGILQVYSDGSGSQNFTTDNSTGQFNLTLDNEVVTRRIRVQPINEGTLIPCMRLDIFGCPVDIPPPEPPKPVVSFRDVSILSCEITVDEVFGLHYVAEWFRDQASISKTLLPNGEFESTLSVDLQDFSSNQKYHCSMKACYNTYCMNGTSNGTFSAAQESDVFTPEILITNDGDLNLTESEIGYIKIKATAPASFLCTAGGRDGACTVTVIAVANDANPLSCPGSVKILPQLLFPDKSDVSTGEAEQCSLQVTNDNWMEERLIAVTPNSGAQLTGVRETQVTTILGLDSQFDQSGGKSITVRTTFMASTVVCEALETSYYQTFDGMRFESYLRGEFILYKHMNLPYEVRTYSRACNNTLTDKSRCTCFVAARVHDDVIVFSGCESGEGITANVLKGEDSETFFVRSYYGGMRQEVTFPTGSLLVVQASEGGGINVWFYPAPIDFGATLGLCGTYDSNSTNDLELREGGLATDADSLLKSWRLSWQTNGSIITGICPKDRQNQSAQLQSFSQCQTADIAGALQAADSYVTCNMDRLFDSDEDRTSFLLQFAEKPANCFLIFASYETAPVFTLGVEGYGNDTTEPIPNYPSGWTEDLALSSCNSAIRESEVSKVCNSSLYLVDEDFNRCVQDIKMTGLTNSAQTLVQVLQERCKASYVQAGPPDDVLDSFCPRNCSSQGACKAGECTCEDGYAGVDCSLNVTTIPTLTRLDQQICNTQTDPCTSVIVYGTDFVEGKDLKCFFINIE